MATNNPVGHESVRNKPTFDSFYMALYGNRWGGLRDKLSGSRESGLFCSPWADQEGDLPGNPMPGVEGARRSAEAFESPPLDPAGMPRWYAMDIASIVAAQSLQVAEGDRVLDMCAAPGGKSLVLASGLGSRGELVVNDRSSTRRARLRKVLDQYLPVELRARVTVSGHDASKWGLHETNAYDRILLDAPCSSERHVLADPKALAQWSPARAKGLARRQYAMLAAALEAVRVGGRILYSTCSLVPDENEGVIERLLSDSKRAGRARVVPLEAPIGEANGHGWAMFPDCSEWGPIWMAAIERLA
ncbi:MAG: 16S rRNA C967 or C1407 C5-methylase (RsmB/RsmF family) [Planctomycetota bacterium]|jgi:16S rRNA C967 or C1407 C5-methylase (RsmB/RsmF family)